MSLVLHSFWRATAPYRVRIALALKGLPYDYAKIDLAGREHLGAAYRALNPQQLAPVLQTDEGGLITQSLAIIEWLEEVHPLPPLLPADPFARAIVRSMAQVIACDVHPLNNPRVQRRLKAQGVDEAGRLAWVQHWINEGFRALEPLVAAHGAGFAFGAAPTLADCCLVPGVYSAERYEIDVAPYPAIAAVALRCADHPAFAAAHPDRQPDAPAAK